MTLQILALISLTIGLLAYVMLTVFCIVARARRITGTAALIASATTLLLMVSLALTGLSPVSLSLGSLSLLAWIALLMRVIGVGLSNARARRLRPVTWVFAMAVGFSLFGAVYPWVLALGLAAGSAPSGSWLFASHLLLSICGLVLLEQVVRNTRDDFRWRLRYLNIGIGAIFSFQVMHSALALMLGSYIPEFLAVEPVVFALAAPFIAIASARNTENPLRVNLSRQFVFRSGMLVATGITLLLLGYLGYLVQALDDWGIALLVLAATVVVLVGITVLGSTAVRLRLRRFVEEHVFARKYDYREEWGRVTERLTEPSLDYDLGQQVIRAFARVLQTDGGAIWRMSRHGVLVHLSELHVQWGRPLSIETSANLQRFFESREWVLDLAKPPDLAKPTLNECGDLMEMNGVRFLIPLITEARVFGVVALTAPHVDLDLSWEDYDVLKLIARQAAGFVALREAERELAEADKLNSFHQVSAFIVHDMKTISSQLSLLTQNAEKHKSNPAFVDDMIATVGNAVSRMQKLLVQLREGEQPDSDVIDLKQELEETIASFAHQQPAPAGRLPAEAVPVNADSSKLRSAVGHLIQNAIDAAALQHQNNCSRPAVTIGLETRPPWAEITIEDTGAGMDAQFIDSVLFQPFSSTKGVAGMGVGAYQARAYARALGGDISVTSRPGQGSTFIIRLPLKAHHG